MRFPTPVVLSLALPALLAAGCGSQQAMQRGAHSAADQVAAFETELQQKINAENNYYHQVFKNAAASIERSRDIRIDRQLQNNAQAFVASQGSSTVTAGELETFMKTAVTSWQTTDNQLKTQLQTIENQLQQGRTEISVDTGKLTSLQNKLAVLAEARTKKQLAGFVFGFLTQTGADLAALRADDTTATTGGATTTGDTTTTGNTTATTQPPPPPP